VQAGESTRRIVLPNPQLIHCRSAQCSKLWKEQSSDEGWVLPAQIRLDTVNDEITGLTAVYEKSVSTQEIRAAIDSVYGKSRVASGSDKLWLWRVEPQQIAIQLTAEKNGENQLIYLKFGTPTSLTPAAHIDGSGIQERSFVIMLGKWWQVLLVLIALVGFIWLIVKIAARKRRKN
jgi:hypothetical protein